MTREEAISVIQSIVDEVSESEDAVCYVTSEDKSALDMAIDVLKAEPCEDCISRADTFKALQIKGDYNTLNEVYERLEKLTSVTPARKKGKWRPLEYDGYADGFPVWDVWECDQCGHEHRGESDTLTDYCPDCGAEMEVEA